MGTSLSRSGIALIAFLGTALATPAWAQGGPGGGMGGQGMSFNQDNVRGWTLMTPEEHTAFQSRMRELKTYDECRAVLLEHRNTMEARAKEKGVKLMAPRVNACERLKARGLIK